VNCTHFAAPMSRGGQKNQKTELKKKNRTITNSFEIELKQFGSSLTVKSSSVQFNGSVFFSKKLDMNWFRTIKPNHFNGSILKINSVIQIDYYKF
jgi:hypothetical protein